MNYFDKALGLVKEAEGFEPLPYRCTAGKLTQGYGRNLEVYPLSEEEEATLNEDGSVSEEVAEKWAYNELLNCELRLTNAPSFKECNDIRKAVLLDMAFNIGFNGLMKFRKMHSAIIEHDWLQAGLEMKDSKYYTDVKSRGIRNVRIMISGEI